MSKGRARFKRLAIYWSGWGFIALGILGIFLPILQGFLFLFIGLLLLSNSSPRAARVLNYLRNRFPKMSKKFDEAAERAARVQARIGAHFENRKRKGRKVDPHKQPGRL